MQASIFPGKTGSCTLQEHAKAMPPDHTPAAPKDARSWCHPGRRSVNWHAAMLAGIALATADTAAAWNDFGHMTAAAVAYQRLTVEARQQSARLLRLNPQYAQWVRGSPAARRDEVAFLRAATWADAIKHLPQYRDDGERPAGPDAGRNIGYADHLQHRYWHFVDVPFSPDGTPLPPVPAPNAATQIHAFSQVVGDPMADDALKSYDLTWLLHLVADIHQPLHAVSRFTQQLPHGDAGGNLVRLCAPPCREELHAFWDAALGSGGPGAALRLAQRLPAATPAAAAADQSVWLSESRLLAEREVYAPLGPGPGPYHLTPAYRQRARQLARRQVALAGARLAHLLNAAFARTAAPRAVR
jgi:hypothetical protein